MLKVFLSIRKLPPRAIQWMSFLYKTLQNFIAANGIICTNSLTYIFVLAFVPLLISLASISELLPFSDVLTEHVEYYFLTRFLPQTGNQILHLFTTSYQHSAKLSLLGLALLISTCYGMMFAVEQHIHQMWHLKRQRKFYHSLLVFTAFFLFGPWLALSLADIEFTFFMNLNKTMQVFITHIFSGFMTMLCTCAVYKFIPTVKVRWKSALIAGALSGGLLNLLRWFFILSMGHFHQEYSLLYGSLAMLPVFLLWLYLSNLIFLYCAQIIYVMDFYSRQRKRQLDRLMAKLRNTQ